MYYRTRVLLVALTLPVLASAGSATSDQAVNDKVDCISDFIASELDQSKHDSYIDECMKKKQEERQGKAAKSG